MQETRFRRPARDYTFSASNLPKDEIEISAPPTLQAGQGGIGGWLQLLLPVVGSLGSLIFIFAYHPSPLLIVAACSMGLIMVVTGIGMRIQQRLMLKKQRTIYTNRLGSVHEDLRKTAALQSGVNDHLYPPSSILLNVVLQRNREQPQLWERRLEDQDFLHVRVGLGKIPLCRPIRKNFGSDPFTQYVPILRAKAEQLADDFAYLANAPVVLDIATIGTLAITGNSLQTRPLMRAILCQIATFHSPEDVRFVTYFPDSAKADWEWLKWLPHVRRLFQVKPEKQFAPEQLCLLADNIADFQELLNKQVAPELERRQRLNEHKQEAAKGVIKPHIVLILDDFTPDSTLAQLPDIQKLFQMPEGNGIDLVSHAVTVICLTNTIRQEPSTIKARISVSETGELTFQKIEAGSSRSESIVADTASVQTCTQIARSLAPLSLADKAGQQDLSLDVRLLDLLTISSAEQIRVADTWQNRSISDLLRVPIGSKADGVPLLLDLKEAADKGMGPHGLVVGAIGSGKSELLRTLVTSLAITHDHFMVNFLLVDFKGGAAFADFAPLPHVAGIVTNLMSDQVLVNRVYDSLQGELERRQRMLRDAGNLGNIKEYQAKWQGNKETMEPMPHLLIIVDEFAELITSRPDFLDLFVQIGRLGRSPGMHLLLSTQRLEEGRIKGLETYLRYRICLRTFSAAESTLALGSSDAFYLPSAPGVGYFKVDATAPTQFKTALIAIPYVPVTEKSTQGVLIREFTPTGKLLTLDSSMNGEGKQNGEVENALQTEMNVVIRRLQDAQYQGKKVIVHQVCLPPLEKSLALDAVFKRTGQTIFDGHSWPTLPPFGPLCMPIGLIDKPREQAQEPLLLDFSGAGGHMALVGAPLSGKSTLLRTLITSLMMTHSPRDVQIYGIDLGGGLLRIFDAKKVHVPHVGSICNRTEREKIRRMLRQMRTTIEERTLLFQERGIDSMQSYRLQRQAGGLTEGTLSDVFLIIDNLLQLRQDFDQIELELMEIISNGLAYGVHVIVTANRWGEIPQKLLQNFGTRLELHIHEPTESDIGKVLAAALPADIPGRGLTKDKLYFQTALPEMALGRKAQHIALQQSLEALVRQTQEAWKGPVAPEIRMLPKRLPWQELPKAGTNQQLGVPIGVDEFQLEPVYIDLTSMGPHFLIFGDGECGKTNLLRLWIRGLEQRYAPDQVQIAVVDYRRTLRDIGQLRSPHLFAYAFNPLVLKESINRLGTELEKRFQAGTNLDDAPAWTGPHYFLFVDDYETIVTPALNPFIVLSELLYNGRDIGFHLVLSRRAAGAAANAYDTVIKRVKDTESPGLLMSANPQEGVLLGTQKSLQMPAGRGYLIRRNYIPTQIQVAYSE